MDLNRFLEERQERWRRLERLLDRVDRGGLEQLTGQQVDELFGLYRLVSSDLNLAQTRTANPAMIEYLEGLVGRAWALMAPRRRVRLVGGLVQILRHRFPAAVRKEWGGLAVAAAAMAAGILFGWLATWARPQTRVVFLSAWPQHLAVTPAERVAQDEQAERTGEAIGHDAATQTTFASLVTFNNIKVSVLAFALGLTFGVGTVVILFYNGAVLGALACWYWQEGVLTFFLAWIGPHGSLELPCILIAAAAGLVLSRCQYRVEGGSTWQQIRGKAGRLVDMLVGVACLLAVAGGIEGSFSQIHEPTLPYAFKIAVSVVLFCALVAYLFFMPVRVEATAGTGPVRPARGAGTRRRA